MAKLSTAARNKLPSSSFAGPGRSFPVHDKAHATAALRLLGRAKSLSSSQKAHIKARAHKVLGRADGGQVGVPKDLHKESEESPRMRAMEAAKGFKRGGHVHVTGLKSKQATHVPMASQSGSALRGMTGKVATALPGKMSMPPRFGMKHGGLVDAIPAPTATKSKTGRKVWMRNGGKVGARSALRGMC